MNNVLVGTVWNGWINRNDVFGTGGGVLMALNNMRDLR